MALSKLDITISLPLKLSETKLGCTKFIYVEETGRKITLTVPPNIKHGAKLRCRDEGIHDLIAKEVGNLIVVVEVVPDNSSLHDMDIDNASAKEAYPISQTSLGLNAICAVKIDLPRESRKRISLKIGEEVEVTCYGLRRKSKNLHTSASAAMFPLVMPKGLLNVISKWVRKGFEPEAVVKGVPEGSVLLDIVFRPIGSYTDRSHIDDELCVCPRCGGKKWFPEYLHVVDGNCFLCHGSGNVTRREYFNYKSRSHCPP